MAEQENIDLLKNAYSAFGQGDMETVDRVLADDIEWTVPGKSVISGTYRGKAEVFGFFGKMAEGGFTTDPQEWYAAGDKVVVVTTTSANGHSGRQVDHWSVRDGKVAVYEAFADTATMAEMWGAA